MNARPAPRAFIFTCRDPPPHPAPRSMSRGISYSLDSIKALETVIERERAELDAKVARDKLV